MPNIVTVGPPKAPVLEPEWVEKTLIFRHTSGRIEAVDAYCYGTLAVHPTLMGNSDKAPIALTHAPSKVALAWFDDPVDASNAAVYLWGACRGAFASVVDYVDKSLIPPKVADWIRECEKQRRFVVNEDVPAPTSVVLHEDQGQDNEVLQAQD